MFYCRRNSFSKVDGRTKRSLNKFTRQKSKYFYFYFFFFLQRLSLIIYLSFVIYLFSHWLLILRYADYVILLLISLSFMFFIFILLEVRKNFFQVKSFSIFFFIFSLFFPFILLLQASFIAFSISTTIKIRVNYSFFIPSKKNFFLQPGQVLSVQPYLYLQLLQSSPFAKESQQG